MKRIIISMSVMLLSAISISLFANSERVQPSNSIATMVSQQGVVFRTIQKLRSNDGCEIYLHPSRKCEMFNESGALVVTCTYVIADNEIRLLDENGNTLYKGSFRYASDHRNIGSLTLAGITYYKKS